MDKHNPEQFDFVGITTNDKENLWGVKSEYTPQSTQKIIVQKTKKFFLSE